MRASAPWGVLVALAAPAPTWALGLGDIELSSALNQPFRATIRLSATADELRTLRVSVADNAAFERSGLDRPAFMSDFHFDVTQDNAGNNVIAVSSNRSVAEPFVTMIVEATWTNGSLLREYTVFLDPPTLLPPTRVATTVAPPQTGARRGGAQAAPIARPPATPQQGATRPGVEAAPRASGPAAAGPSSRPAGDRYGPVRPSETLWEIAERYQPAGISMNQTMLAIYEANTGSFGGNMNVLRVGSILRIPSRNEFGATSPGNATAEVRRQDESWRNRVDQPSRLELVPPTTEAAIAQSRDTSAAPAAADNGAVAELRDELASLRGELAESRRLIELRDQEMRDLQDQLAAFAAAAANTQPAAAPAVTAPAATTPAATPPAAGDGSPRVFADDGADSTPAAEPPTVEPESPAPAATPPASTRSLPSVTTQPATQGESLLSRLIGWISGPIALIVAGAAAVLFAGLWFMRRRREDEAEDVTGQWDAIEAGMAETRLRGAERLATASSEALPKDTGPFVVDERRTQTSTTLPIEEPEAIAADHFAKASAEEESIDDTLSTSAVINLDEADPVAEADFHMAYGLYDQAADLLTKELDKDPERRDLHLKLLEVYFVWGNKTEFLRCAEALREHMGGQRDGDWDKVLIMGKQICPEADLFSDAGQAAGSGDAAFAAGGAGSLDFAFDESGEHAMDIDIDIGDATRIGEASFDEAPAVDLDLTGNQPGPALESTDMLDIGAETALKLEKALTDESEAAEAEGQDAQTELPAGVDPESLVATQESPRLDPGEVDEDAWLDLTVESPTVEHKAALGADEDEDAEEVAAQAEATQLRETAILDPKARVAAAEAAASAQNGGTEYTAEIDVNELGLDVDAIDALPDDLDTLASQLEADLEAGDSDGDTREQPALEVDIDPDFLSATGITQVLEEQKGVRSADADAAKQQASKAGGLAETELLEQPTDVTSSLPRQAIQVDDESTEMAIDLDELSDAMGREATGRQRSPAGAESDSGTSDSFVDLDVGEGINIEEETTATEGMQAVDPQTLTEVGTKLDLARAYIDMGDPDGAKSILEEVMAEGDMGQREEAQTLMKAIGE